MRLLPFYPLLLLAATACVPLGTPITDPNAARRPSAPGQQAPEYYADKTLRYEDATYDPNVRTVQCYMPTGQANEVFTPPIVPLVQGQPLALEFDVLGGQGQRLTAKLIHCDVNWQPSVLTDMQFLNEINEQNITDYRASVNTKVPYYHYRVRMPRVKLSGNYLWVVQGPGGTPLLSRRVLVFDEGGVQVFLKQGIPVAGQERYTLQQLDFGIRYSMNLVNPAQEVKVVLRQNFRWDNARYNLRPTFVRDAERQLDYQYFNFENAFPGLSEFRFFDLRTFRALGQGVAKLDAEASPRTAVLLSEATRNGQGYTQYDDINGQRVIESREYGNGATNGEYLDVTFQLRAAQAAPGPVYVLGALTDWKLKDEFKLTYDLANQVYTGHALLKQGYYNYIYAVQTPQGPNSVYWEGSHQETENQYDLLVYYRPPGTRSDLLIGYQTVTVNGRRP
ncbi:type IX secretion system plug protein [Hymenobacter tenuis]